MNQSPIRNYWGIVDFNDRIFLAVCVNQFSTSSSLLVDKGNVACRSTVINIHQREISTNSMQTYPTLYYLHLRRTPNDRRMLYPRTHEGVYKSHESDKRG